MEAKRSFDYEGKTSTRQILGSFIRRYIDKEPAEIRVVCLPGAEARDIIETYDPLRIPRENITGIEMDKKVAERLRKADWGINLVEGTDSDFFRQAEGKYDVISLDYFQQFSPAAMETLATIFSRQLLAPKAVLHTNFYGGREQESTRKSYAFRDDIARMATEVMVKMRAEKGLEQISPSEIDKALREMGVQGNTKDSPVPDLRRSIPANIIEMAGRGISSYTDIQSGCLMDAKNCESVVGMFDSLFQGTICVDDEVQKRYVEDFWEYGQIFMYAAKIGAYLPAEHRSMKYISDDRSPMLTDIFVFDQHPDWFDGKWPDPPAVADMIRKRGVNSFVKRCINHYKEVSDAFRMTGRFDCVQEGRTDLGSSFKPKLTPQKAQELLRQGATDEDIMREYRVSVRRLAAFKAWHTMRKQDKSASGGQQSG